MRWRSCCAAPPRWPPARVRVRVRLRLRLRVGVGVRVRVRVRVGVRVSRDDGRLVEQVLQRGA